MYRVFLVDGNADGKKLVSGGRKQSDGVAVLSELARMIPWETHGFVVLGRECDMDRAAERIAEEKPDVVICDLDVSEENSLSKVLMGKGVQTEFVLAAQKGNFESVREFFRGGGYDYVINPGVEEMEDVLRSLRKKLDRDKGREDADKVI